MPILPPLSSRQQAELAQLAETAEDRYREYVQDVRKAVAEFTAMSGLEPRRADGLRDASLSRRVPRPEQPR